MRRLLLVTAPLFWPFFSLAQVPLNTVPTLALGQPAEILASELRSAGPNWVEGRELNSPFAVATDPNTGALYVADTANNRVLAWRTGTTAGTGSRADLVIGQRDGDRYSTVAGAPALLNSGLDRPTGLVVDRSSNLYVVDSGNNRILRYKRPFEQPAGTILADLVIGQPNPSSAAAGVARNRIRTISGNTILRAGLAFDAQGNLFFTDAGNHRLLRFPASALGESATHGPDADLLIGQQTYDASSTPARNVQNRESKAVLLEPSSLAFDTKGRLFVADGLSRIVVYEAPIIPQQSAARILGVYRPAAGSPKPLINEFSLGLVSGNQLSPPYAVGVFTIGDSVFATDAAAHRVMRYAPYDNWQPESALPFQPAEAVIGQDNLSSDRPLPNRGGIEPRADTLSTPLSGASGPGETYVADAGNNRVLIFPNLSTGGATSPTYTALRVLGQSSFEFRATNLLEGREFGFMFPGVEPSGGIAVDRTSDPPRLYVADTYNNRVLCYADARGLRSPDKASIVIGQVGLERSITNWPTGSMDSRNASGLLFPTGVAVDSQGNLWVADRGNARVLRFPSPFANPKNLPDADLVIGQSDFVSKITDPTDHTLGSPYGLAFTQDGWLLVSDVTQNRVLLFQPPFQNGMAAVKVFGQPNMSSREPGTTANRLSAPHHIATDSEDRLYVTDFANRRVQVFGRVITAATDPSAVLTLANYRAPSGIHVNSQTGEIWVAEQDANNQLCTGNVPCALRYPRFDTLVSRGPNPDTVFRGIAPLALTQDGFGDLLVADQFNRVLIYFPGTSATNAASYVQRSAPGMITSLFLPNIQSIVTKQFIELPNPLPLPTELSDVQVLVNGTLAPIYFVSPSQINFLMPNRAPSSGTAEVLVLRPSTRQILAAAQLRMEAAAPGFFTKPQTGTGQIAALNQNSTENSSTNGARVGEVVALFGTGSGFVPNAPPDGYPVEGQTPTDVLPRILFNSRFLEGPENIPYSGLAPNLVGVWQVNVRIPDFAPPGDNVIIMTMKDIPSNDPSRPGRIRATVYVTR